jgi:hypothetical protein
MAGVVDMKPTDPIAFRGQYKVSATRLQSLTKAALLTERLDQHRGRGQQQRVNADQAVVADQIVSGGSKNASTAALLTSGTEKPMEILEPTHTEAVPVRTE